MSKADRILKKAEALARSVKSWADLSNALYSPVSGLVTTAYPSPEERETFRKSGHYRRLQVLLNQARKQHGLVAGGTPSKSGRFVVRLPRSLHAALEMEAQDEGVSLNQLVVAKLAAQLRSLTVPPKKGSRSA